MIRLSTTCHHSLCKGLHSCWFMFPCPTSIHTHPAVGRPTPLGPEGNAGYQLAILSGAECMDLLASNMPGIRPQPTSSLVLRSWPRCHHKSCLFQNPWIGILYKGALHLVFAFTVSIFDDPLHTSSAQAGTKSCRKQDYRSENVEKNSARLVAGVAVQICLSKQTQKDPSGSLHSFFHRYQALHWVFLSAQICNRSQPKPWSKVSYKMPWSEGFELPTVSSEAFCLPTSHQRQKHIYTSCIMIQHRHFLYHKQTVCLVNVDVRNIPEFFILEDRIKDGTLHIHH